MSQTATTAAEPAPIPTHVDVTPQPGRRVRTPDGDLLPEGHVLRGEPRSAYWLRKEIDGDVALTPHDPAAVAADAAVGQDPVDPVSPPAPPLAETSPAPGAPASDKSGGRNR